MTERHARERDDETLAGLRDAVARFDPVPPAVREGALAAFGWRTIDADLAALVHDSALDDRELEGVRGGDGPRLVTFEGPGLTVEVEVAPHGRRRRLVGQLVPPGPATVRVHQGDGVASAEADELGRFVVEGVAAGPVRVGCERPGDRLVHTEWVTL